MLKNLNRLNYVDYLGQLYEYDIAKEVGDFDKFDIPVLNATFQITEDCCCSCSYCYQTNKSPKKMSNATVKQCVDALFNMLYSPNQDFLNPDTNIGIILEFIGGEPLMNIEAIDTCCTYFYNKCIELHHPWAYTWKGNMISNGKFYFDEKFQRLLEKFPNRLLFNVTIDGPKEMHDKCRVYHDGKGNFDDAWKAITDYRKRFFVDPPTKVTISPDNLEYFNDTVKFFLENNFLTIHANPIYEHEWSTEEGKLYYKQLKEIADYVLNFDSSEDIYFSIFSEIGYKPKKADDLHGWCGGDGRMISFDTQGDIYPCIRYMESSLNGQQEPVCIGNCYRGVYQTDKEKKLKEIFYKANRKTESNDECFNCPIVSACGTCIAQAYQETGELCKRSVNACNMHKAASLASCYFWNKYYIKNNIPKHFKRYLTDEESLRFISQDELDQLNMLENETLRYSCEN